MKSHLGSRKSLLLHKVEIPMTIVKCLPEARAPGIQSNLKVLVNAYLSFSKMVIHIHINKV